MVGITKDIRVYLLAQMEPSFLKSLACVARCSSQLRREKRAAKPLERVGGRNEPRGEWEGDKEKNACPKARPF